MRQHIENKANDKYRGRLIKFLIRGAAKVHSVADGKIALLERTDAQKLKLPFSIVTATMSDGLVLCKMSRAPGVPAEIRLSSDGVARLKKSREAVSSYKTNSLSKESFTKETNSIKNDGSPLARLYCVKKSKSGSWLTKEEFHAGERLRIDFEKSQVAPALGVNWDSFGMPRASLRGSSAANASEFAEAAHQRLSRALTIVGPEMADLLLDVCCFLKGLERVEAERGWPRRSAKLLLKVALASLDRHYNPKPLQVARRLRTWNSEIITGHVSA